MGSNSISISYTEIQTKRTTLTKTKKETDPKFLNRGYCLSREKGKKKSFLCVTLIVLTLKTETFGEEEEAMTVCVSSLHTLFPNSKVVAVLSRAKKMRVHYDLKQGQSRLFHELPSGLSMEVIVQKKKRTVESPPLVFVHGSYHAAWCWAEHWFPFFSSSGYDCYALSLLGQGESDAPIDSVAGTLQTHARDVADFIYQNIKSPPVLLGHSFGGLIIQYYISKLGDKLEEDLFPKLGGAVLVCSVPPSGNSGIVWRYLFSKPITAFKVTRSLAAKGFQTSLSLCRETFFSATMEDHVVQRYQELMKESSSMPLFDLRKLNASLPVSSAPKDCPLEILVLGAKNDFIVDAEGLKETAKFYGVPPVWVEDVAHDMMLDVSWEKGAKVILSWLNGLEKTKYRIDDHIPDGSFLGMVKRVGAACSASAEADAVTLSHPIGTFTKMYTSRKKIHKDKDAEPTEFEETVAQSLFDLENTNQELKGDLKDLYINQAIQIDVAENRKAVVIYVPYRLRKAFRKIHPRLLRELEKKFSGKDVVLVATRRILRPPKKGSAVQRPRTRTLTAVHDAMLEDVVYPAEIVGKRVRYRLDGSKIIKVFLDSKERNNTEYKLDTFSRVYRKLTGKDVTFEYPITDA
ncbi:hypothetical protein RJT34_18701 [Clitoria ternatea]|uniref:AB hydrolase-1 domain-containing protein n=1 Tax=Clitoria ternatea TaxID=43366 RepID=A0AAN9PFP1_CLITE